MPEEPVHIPKVYRIQMMLGQYPILGDIMRERMRRELFRRGVIAREHFEDEVREKAHQSQRREGLCDPDREEPAEVWQRRLARVRDSLTEFYWAYNMSSQAFEEIAREVLDQHPSAEQAVTLNPEMASLEILFQQLESLAELPADEQVQVAHYAEEIKVALIRALLSDELEFVRVAKEHLGIADLKWVRDRRLGRGKIGGKAAGLVLGWQILEEALRSPDEPDGGVRLQRPETCFVGADVFYEFSETNEFLSYLNQKYKPIDRIEREYAEIQAAYAEGRFPEGVTDGLRGLLARLAGRPLVVRSSSLLEDTFGSSLAGMYESVFCPNQGAPEENLAELKRAIGRVYASVFNPDVLLYRRRHGVLDFDERMAVLIQAVQGERYGDYYYPAVAGMACSVNPFLWNAKLRREDGFARLVVGLGTRAVVRAGEDYPRIVALSHPGLRPESGVREIKFYSQYHADVIDLRKRQFVTLPVGEVLGADTPGLRLLASVDHGDHIGPLVAVDRRLDGRSLVITLEGLLTQTSFPAQLRKMLKALESSYNHPVDVEFTLSLGREQPQPSITIHLVQCRPHETPLEIAGARLPEQLAEADIIFGANKLVPTGRVCDVAAIVYVDPEPYRQASATEKIEVGRLIGRLNRRLEGRHFILMGPGRWGSSNIDLGVKVNYADFYNARVLVEIGSAQGRKQPALSYGTHFFQDLVESHIYPLAIEPGRPGNPFNQAFFDSAPNALAALLPEDAALGRFVKVIDVPAAAGGRLLELVMSGEEGRALAFLTGPDAPGR